MDSCLLMRFLGDVDVKLCCVLVEGGPDALAMAVKNAKRSTPLVIVNNSGRISDAISYAFKNTEPAQDKSKK